MKRRHKVVATNAQIESALARARAFVHNDRRLCSAFYDRNADRICLVLPDDIQVSIPRRQLQGLENAKPAQLSQIELLGGGTGIHWPQLDVSHYVLGLLNNVFGTAAWMAHLGRRGGSSRSAAKAAAARANGRRGGRPRSTGKKNVRKLETGLRARSA